MKEWNGPPLRDVDLDNYTMCFACGRDNPIGLKLKLQRDGEAVRTDFAPEEQHQGWPGIVHGGIINTILDEAMAYVPFLQGINCVTAKMGVRLRSAAYVGQRIFISSRITRKTRRLVEAKAEISLEDGTPVAESKAIMYIIEEA
jgi:acyl-coenzyme A thioesterase PaaI-like protein